MKKFSFFLCAGIALLATACSGEKADKTNDAPASSAVGEAYETELNIRYVNQDSIYKNYTFAEAIAQSNQQLQVELMAYGNQLQSQLQNLQQQFQEKMQNNRFLNESAAQAEYNSLQQKAANYDKLLNQRQAQTQEKVVANAQALQDSINNFIADFNKEYKYDAILIQENVLYINPALDITQEVVDGLNARYKVPVDTKAEDKKDDDKKADDKTKK